MSNEETMNMRRLIIKELSNATATLQKYESKLLEGGVSEADKPFYQSRIDFWSSSVVELRKQLFETKTSL